MSLTKMNEKNPDFIKSMYDYRRVVFKDGKMSAKDKEIIAFVIANVTKCEKCLDYHAEAAMKMGATKEELREALEVTAYMVGPSALIWSPKIDEYIE